MKQLLAILFTFLFFITAYSQVTSPFQEEFDLINGSLNGQNGWSGNTFFQVVTDDMNLGNYFFTNNEEKAACIQTSGGTIRKANPNPFATGTVYLSFLVKIEDINQLGTVPDFQVGIDKTVFTTGFAGVGFYNDGGDIKAALSTVNTEASSTQVYVEDKVYHVVFKYEFILGGNDIVSAFISDVFMTTEPAVATITTTVNGTGLLDNIGSVILASPNPNPGTNVPVKPALKVDGLQLGNEWNGSLTTLVAAPIELKRFSGTQKNSQIQLDWITASEYDNDYFTIEKSKDGVEFSSIGEVSSMGDSQYEVAYQLIDGRPYSGQNYYRLKQTDFDGTSTTSKIIVVDMENQQEPKVKIFPNPVTDYFLIELAANAFNRKGTVNVISANGQVILNQAFDGSNNIQIQTNDWTSGWYAVQLYFQDGKSMIEKIFIQ